ncbi:hypothetical protein TNCV_4190771 [Trichonephila clavipes]|nr:hypothetical protein TNCV_4190771 [Trichonephila clavipes]
MTWQHCRRSSRCSVLKGAWKGKARLDLKICLCKVSNCLWNNCYATSARIVERVTVIPQVLAARSFDPLSSWFSWSLQARFSTRGYLLVSTALQQFLTAHSNFDHLLPTRRVNQPAVFIPK